MRYLIFFRMCCLAAAVTLPVHAVTEDGDQIEPNIEALKSVLQSDTSEMDRRFDELLERLNEEIAAMETMPEGPGRAERNKVILLAIDSIALAADAFEEANTRGEKVATVVADLLTESMANAKASADIPEPGETIEGLELTNGTVYESAVVKSVDPAAVVIQHERGAARIPIQNLAPDWRVRFGYDPDEARRAAAAEVENQARIAGLLAKEAARSAAAESVASEMASTVGGGAVITDEKDPSVAFTDVAMQETRRSSAYVYVAWKATVINQGTTQRDVDVKIAFRTAAGFEVESEVEYNINLDPGQSRRLSGQRIIEDGEWAQVKAITAETR